MINAQIRWKNEFRLYNAKLILCFYFNIILLCLKDRILLTTSDSIIQPLGSVSKQFPSSFFPHLPNPDMWEDHILHRAPLRASWYFRRGLLNIPGTTERRENDSFQTDRIIFKWWRKTWFLHTFSWIRILSASMTRMQNNFIYLFHELEFL